MAYYYFISQLPIISIDAKRGMTSAEFLSKSREYLSDKDYRALSALSLSQVSKSEGAQLAEYSAFIKKVRKITNEMRKEKLGWGKAEVDENDLNLVERIRKAVFSLNPLEGEKEILSIYFEYFEKMRNLDPFSFSNLLLYYMLLQIAEKRDAFDEVEGRKEFESLFSVLEDTLLKDSDDEQ